MAGFPPVYFNIQGFRITAWRTEDHFFRNAESSDNVELNRFIMKYLKDSHTEDRNELEMLLENAVADYKASLNK